jgi:outer membrane protein
MIMNLRGGVYLIAALALSGNAGAETLYTALRMAEASNPELASGRTDAELASEALEEAHARGRPTVSVIGSGGFESLSSNRETFFDSGQTGDRPVADLQLEAAKPVYTGGRIRAGIRGARAGIRAADGQLDAVRQSVFLRTITAYMDVIRDREAVAIRENNVSVLREQVTAARDRFDVGVVTRTDVAQAEARFEGARAELASARAQLEASAANYEAVTGARPGELTPPPPLPPLPDGFETALETARTQNPSLEAARDTVVRANEAVEEARAAGRPQVEIVGRAGARQTFDNDFRDTEVVGLARATVPLWQGGLVSSQVRSAKLRRTNARLEVTRLERSVRAETTSAWFAYQAAERAITASQRQVEAAEVAFDSAEQELAVGTRTTLDVLDTEQDFLNARLALVTAERDAYVAAHRLLSAMGVLDLSRLAPAEALAVRKPDVPDAR